MSRVLSSNSVHCASIDNIRCSSLQLSLMCHYCSFSVTRATSGSEKCPSVPATLRELICLVCTVASSIQPGHGGGDHALFWCVY